MEGHLLFSVQKYSTVLQQRDTTTYKTHCLSKRRFPNSHLPKWLDLLLYSTDEIGWPMISTQVLFSLHYKVKGALENAAAITTKTVKSVFKGHYRQGAKSYSFVHPGAL